MTKDLRPGVGALLALVGLACAPIATAGPGCQASGEPVLLPEELVESSGVAVGRRDQGIFWTHDDSGSDLHAIDGTGRIRGTFPLGVRLRDWEDIEIASCGAASCLYLADTGDNGEERPAGEVRILRVVEPDAAQPGPLEPDVFPIRLPDGPRDIEALFVLPGERLYLVTKGRSHAITVYRYPGPLRPDTVTLQEVQRLTGAPASLTSQVTGASASRDGSIVAIRTYQSLQFYRADGDTLSPSPGGLVNLRTLREMQGEGVGLGPDGLVVLTTEGGPLGGPAAMVSLRCDLT